MFIERLDCQQFLGLKNDLTSPFNEISSRNWSLSITKQKSNDVRLHLSVRFSSDYDIVLDLYDFDIRIWETGMLTEEFIIKTFFMFMYRTFGEEYKTAYLANAAKIFDEE